jgi:tetratricopeptide (TPR) repeat protein/predicted Ser/Thr protein kinase
MAPNPSPAAPTSAEAAGLERGQTIDRFVVLGLVGRGGMGEVYAAYDPELDRKVAIKLLRARGDAAEGRTRLLREAQAIAKLSHPNVVVVYDVGTFGESVFIAMEFVEGHTLTGWMQAARSQREILEVFLAAGRGLAAAHAAGLVHRDFKPDNVMVTNDGQVRVMDFGLARQTGEDRDPEPKPAAAAPEADAAGRPASDFVATVDPAVDPDATLDLGARDGGNIQSTSGKYLSLKLTQTGAMLGTPAYMAPEQFGMKATDARTDQFSFCVALYEMLYGRRPFAGDTFMVLMTNVATGTIAEPPAKARVPGWMRKVLLRGLSVDPEGRHPSMNALLTALQTDPTVRIRRTALILLAVVVLAVGAIGARKVAGTRVALCAGGGARWAGVWEAGGAPSARKDAIHRAFVATGRANAERAFAAVSRLLDDYVAKWLGMYGDACEATHVRGEQSAEVLDLRMSCMQERLTGASALSDLFSRADAATVDNALAAAGGLPRLERCADVASLKALVKPPEDPKTRQRVEDLRKDLARFSAEKWGGNCSKLRPQAADLVASVRQTAYLPLIADTLFQAAMLGNTNCADGPTAIANFKESFTTAVSARYDEAAAAAATVIAGHMADREGRVAEARDWLAIGKAELARFENHPLLDAWLLNSEGELAYTEGRGADAVDLFAKTLSLKERILPPDSPDRVFAAVSVCNSLALVRRYDEALRVCDDLRATYLRLFGPTGGMLATIELDRGEVLQGLKQYREAHESFQRALDVWRGAGTDAVTLSYALDDLGLSLIGEGRPLEAIDPLEEALASRLANHSAADILSESRFALARALWARPAHRARALVLARDARADVASDATPSAKEAVAKIDAWLAAPAARL